MVAVFQFASLGSCVEPVLKFVLVNDAQFIGFSRCLNCELTRFKLSDFGNDALPKSCPDPLKIDLKITCRLQQRVTLGKAIGAR